MNIKYNSFTNKHNFYGSANDITPAASAHIIPKKARKKPSKKQKNLLLQSNLQEGAGATCIKVISKGIVKGILCSKPQYFIGTVPLFSTNKI